MKDENLINDDWATVEIARAALRLRDPEWAQGATGRVHERLS